MSDQLDTPERTAVPFDKDLSLGLDRATIAWEEAKQRGDETRMLYATAWKRRIERLIWGDET